jgi:hypothetical protein
MPGLFERAFRVTLPGDQISQWIFLGIAVTVSNASQPCHPAPAPSSLPPAVVSVPYSQQLAATGGLAPLQWSAISALPPGLTLSLNGTLAGIPLSVGTFPLTVRATDGATPATRTYQLVVGAGVAINDAVSTRAPGFTPQFRVVTNAAATIAATASCNVSEFVVTGGGSCTVPNSNTVQGRMASSQPASNGWTVTCSGGTATAVVVCQVR